VEVLARVAVRQLLHIVSVALLLVSNAQAAVQGIGEEDYPVAQSEEEKKELVLGLHGGIAVNYKNDSNIYRSRYISREVDSAILKSGENVVGDTAISLIPSLLYKGEALNRHPYSLNLVGEFARYQKYSTEDYDDLYALADMTLDLTKRLDINLEANYIKSHDARAVPASRINFDLRPDQWELGRLFAEIVYGRKTNKAQLKAFVEGIARPYTNNRQQTRSRNRLKGGATFFLNTSPKMSLLAAVTFADIDYYHGATPIDLSSLESNFSLGIRWEATGKTTGQIKVGYLVKDLEDESLRDFAGLSAQATILWEPKTYSRVKLLIQRRTDESIQYDSSYFVTTRLAASWEHDLKENLTFALRFDGQNDRYSAERDDDLLDYAVDLDYDMNKRLDIGFRYIYSLKTSNMENTDYIANIFLLKIALKTL